MKLSLLASLLLAASFAVHAQTGNSRMISAEPDSGKRGEVITVTGENLDKGHIAKLYLTDGKDDVEVQMTEQTETTIKFKIPPKATAGRLALMILTTAKPQQLIEQPVKVTVEEAQAPR
jgi:hypothetical protein